MLNRGIEDWFKPVHANEIARGFYQYLMEKEYRKKIDFSEPSSMKLWEFNQSKIANLIRNNPMRFLSHQSNGLFNNSGNTLEITIHIDHNDAKVLHGIIEQICEYRLREYFDRKSKK
jgi:hypothetical protein